MSNSAEIIQFQSSNNKTKIHAKLWETNSKPKAILQIVHGMAEHIARYEDFAIYMNQKGFLVCGNDHLGHGETALSEEDLGYFAAQNGSLNVVDDVKKLHDIVVKKYSNVPYFLLGHSMGSFIARMYLGRYPNDLHGAIIMGTATQPQIALCGGKAICKLLSIIKGWNHKSKLVEHIATGSYNKKFSNENNSLAWLSKDASNKNSYLKDSKSGFTLTLNGYYNLFDMLQRAQKQNNIDNVSKDLPILVVSGKDDPVGDFGKGVCAMVENLQKSGIKNVELKLYDNCRHEILNESNYKIIYDDLYEWINKNL